MKITAFRSSPAYQLAKPRLRSVTTENPNRKTADLRVPKSSYALVVRRVVGRNFYGEVFLLYILSVLQRFSTHEQVTRVRVIDFQVLARILRFFVQRRLSSVREIFHYFLDNVENEYPELVDSRPTGLCSLYLEILIDWHHRSRCFPRINDFWRLAYFICALLLDFNAVDFNQ